MSDPRRPTKTTPDYIRNGRLICTRNCAGSYTHTDRNFNRWLIERTYEPDSGDPSGTIAGDKPTGFWTYRRDNRAPDDIFCTKAEAIENLQIGLYGAYTRGLDYNR